MQLRSVRLTCEGEPELISICHCLECQKRTGSVYGTRARFPREHVTMEGRSSQWSRTSDAGMTATFHFCPVCGSTVYWEIPDSIYVAVGAFSDPNFPAPRVSVYEERRRTWVLRVDELGLEHQR